MSSRFWERWGRGENALLFLLFELGDNLVPDLYVEWFVVVVLDALTVLRVVCAEDKSVGGAEDGVGVHGRDAVDEHSSGSNAVGVFDPSTWLRTGLWVVVGCAVDIRQDGHESQAVVGDFENVLLDRVGVERFWGYGVLVLCHGMRRVFGLGRPRMGFGWRAE